MTDHSKLSKKIIEYSSSRIVNAHYLFPTFQNLSAGNYQSEILDVQDAYDRNDLWVGYDF